MELKDAIYGRRSIRKYNDEKISDKDLIEIVERGTWAPSGVNLQPWYFCVVRSEEKLKILQKLMGDSFFHIKKSMDIRFKNHPHIVEETRDFLKSMGNASACILAFLLKDQYDEEFAAIESVAAGLQNITLSAYEKGIASCWLTAPLQVEDKIRAEFGQNKGRLIAAMTLGYAIVEPKAPPRKNGRFNLV